jgi:apolipoprotein D and lipocalin family protein
MSLEPCRRHTLFILLALVLGACSSGSSKLPPLKTVPQLDLEAFMGDWWVLANLPTPTEKNCHNALEQYKLNPDKTVAVTFSCNKDSFDGKREVNHFTGLVQNPGTNSEWKIKMKLWGFIPLKLPFLVIDLATDGSYTVIGYPSREYVWIMARAKSLPEKTWTEILARLKTQGYDISKIQRVPTR